MTLTDAETYLLARLAELPALYPSKTPWVFLASAAFLDYLAKLVKGHDDKGRGYKHFIRTWLSLIRPDYVSFKYRSGTADLPEQMYHVLRCGIVHSFSFIPDVHARQKGGRDRSIVLCHREESIAKGLPHLSLYGTAKIADAAVFVAEDFIDDVVAVTTAIFKTAGTDPQLTANIKSWLKQHPPLAGGF